MCAATRRADTRCPAPPDATQTNAMPPVATSRAARSPASGAFVATAVRRSTRSLAARQRNGDRNGDRDRDGGTAVFSAALARRNDGDGAVALSPDL